MACRGILFNPCCLSFNDPYGIRFLRSSSVPFLVVLCAFVLYVCVCVCVYVCVLFPGSHAVSLFLNSQPRSSFVVLYVLSFFLELHRAVFVSMYVTALSPVGRALYVLLRVSH